MPTHKVRVTDDNIKWLQKNFETEFMREYGDKPSYSHLVNMAIKQLVASFEGKTFEMKYNKKTKTLRIYKQ